MIWKKTVIFPVFSKSCYIDCISMRICRSRALLKRILNKLEIRLEKVKTTFSNTYRNIT